MPELTDVEARLLAEVSGDFLWENTEAIARWERVSGTAAEREAVAYLRARLDSYGLQTAVHEFEALLGWPEESRVEIRAPETAALESITYSFVPSTPDEGVDAEAVYLGPGDEAAFRTRPVAGRVAIVEGMANPSRVLRAQEHGAAGLIFIAADRLHDMCVSPVWGTPTTATARLLPRIPVASVTRDGGERLKHLLEGGAVRVWMRTRTFWGWRKVPILVGELPGSVEPDRFVLLSGHYCSWYRGAMDNGAANATMLEVARVLAANRSRLRRGLRVAFWPGHTQGRYAGSTWYFDHFWEDLRDNCVLHVNVDSPGARGASVYRSLSMAETREFALGCLADAIGVAADPQRQSRAGDQSFWSCGVPSMWMDLSQVPLDRAADLGGSGLFTAEGQQPIGGMPRWWHTAEDTIDKIDRDVLERDTRAYLLACWRATSVPVLPFRYSPAAAELRGALERYQAGAGSMLDLGLAIERAMEMEEVATRLDALLDLLRARPEAEDLAAAANRAAMEMDRVLVALNYSAAGPFDQDPALPTPPLPLLEPASRLASMDPEAWETRFLVTELTRSRNRVAFELRKCLEAGRKAVEELSEALS